VRIAYVTETWLPSIDGVVTRLRATVTELLAAGHEVLIIAPTGSRMQIPGATVRPVPTIGWRYFYGGKRWGLPAPRVGRYLREFNPDVVHVINPILLGIAGVLSARRQHRPLIASYHTDVARYARCYRLGVLTPAIWLLLRTLHRRADLNLVTSTTSRARLSAHGIERIRLWPRGVDVHRFHPAAGRPIASSGKPVALYVGRLATEKGLDQLAGLADPGSGFDLVLVGDGPQRDRLQRELGGSARFAGALTGSALSDAYRRADVFVFPSTTDTLGLVLLEALASGLPIVAADSPASREILGDCAAARLFPADRPEQLVPLIRELLASTSIDGLALIARRHATGHDWQAATARLLDFYRHVSASTDTSRMSIVPACSAPSSLPDHADDGDTNAAATGG
jgi:glycosyltransferase involved in cell wall biosynthesis